MKKGSLSCVKKGEARTVGGRREMGDTDRPVIISLILDTYASAHSHKVQQTIHFNFKETD